MTASARVLSPGRIAAAAQLACLLEVHAPKPGNVSPGHDFDDMGVDDFLASAAAIGPSMLRAGDVPLGATILAAVRATREWTSANTNLGIVLLLSPIARAASRPAFLEQPRVVLERVLSETTVEDARSVYAAIRLVAPGGLGAATSQDVAAAPTVSLLEAMRLAADRDDVAREYATQFETTFEVGVPAVRRMRAGGAAWTETVVDVFLTLLARRPDTHIARRAGSPAAADVAERARNVLDHGGGGTHEGRHLISQLDLHLRGQGNLLNPGTTADLTTAALFVELLTRSAEG